MNNDEKPVSAEPASDDATCTGEAHIFQADPNKLPELGQRCACGKHAWDADAQGKAMEYYLFNRPLGRSH